MKSKPNYTMYMTTEERNELREIAYVNRISMAEVIRMSCKKVLDADIDKEKVAPVRRGMCILLEPEVKEALRKKSVATGLTIRALIQQGIKLSGGTE